MEPLVRGLRLVASDEDDDSCAETDDAENTVVTDNNDIADADIANADTDNARPQRSNKAIPERLIIE